MDTLQLTCAVAFFAMGCGRLVAVGPDAQPDTDAPGDAPLDVAFDVVDGGAPDVAPIDSGADADGGCNALVNGAPWVGYTVSTNAVPAAQGGAIVPGLYYMTAETQYLGVDAGLSSRRWTIMVSAGDIDSVFEDMSPPGEVRASWTYGLYGTFLAGEIVCPYNYPINFGYTATPTQLRLYDGTIEKVFDLQ